MDILKSINNMNLTIARSGDRLRLRGLAALRPDQRNSVINYVRDHKDEIMAALSTQSSIDSDLPSETVLDFNGKKVCHLKASGAAPKLRIEKMEQCLHGRSCRYLKSEPPARPICEKAGGPVWDLKECPIWKWK